LDRQPGRRSNRPHEIHQKDRYALLAAYLIVHGLLGFGLPLGPAVFLIDMVALAAGIFVLVGKWILAAGLPQTVQQAL
jgi:hypothetical protein